MSQDPRHSFRGSVPDPKTERSAYLAQLLGRFCSSLGGRVAFLASRIEFGFGATRGESYTPRGHDRRGLIDSA